MIISKLTKSFVKSDVSNQKSLGVGFRKLCIAHKATGGETFIDLTNLTVPTELTTNGFVQPSTTEILSSNILFYKDNVSLFRSVGGNLIPYSEFQIVTSSKINITTAASVNEIFYIIIDPAPTSGSLSVDARIIHDSGTLAANTMDIAVNGTFAINSYPSSQIGEVALFIDGILQMRNINNEQSGSTGNYFELNNVGGFGSILRMNASDISDHAYVVVSTVAIVQRLDGSRDAMIETANGIIDKMVPYLAVVCGVPETTFQSAPSDVNLKQFGDDFLLLKNKFNLKKYIGTGYDYADFDSCINACSTGDTIVFTKGVYTPTANYNVNKSVMIECMYGCTFNGSGAGTYGFYVTSPDVIINLNGSLMTNWSGVGESAIYFDVAGVRGQVMNGRFTANTQDVFCQPDTALENNFSY